MKYVWWNPDSREAISKSKKALKAFQKNPSVQNCIPFKRLCAVSRRILSKKKKNSGDECVSLLTSQTSIAEVWKKSKADQERTICYNYRIVFLSSSNEEKDFLIFETEDE